MAQTDLHVPTLTLSNGRSIPQLAFGVGTALARPQDAAASETIVATFKQAIKLGYRHFDGAQNYKNETELGRAIRESGIPRKEFFVTTKGGSAIEDLPKSLDESLEKLGMDYVDLFLIHSPFYKVPEEQRGLTIQDRWKQMEQIYASGKARAIGVSNFMVRYLEAAAENASVLPMVNQIEYHPYLQRTALLDFQKSKAMIMAAYGPIGPVRGGAGGPLDSLLLELATKYAVSESEICLRYVIDKGGIAITTSTKEERMRNYLRVLSFRLSAEDMERLDKVGAETHYQGYFADRIPLEERDGVMKSE